MTEIDADHDEKLRMPAPWWSIQWLSIRIIWGLIVGALLTRGMDQEDGWTVIFGLAIALIVFVVLTVIARRRRREWADANS